MHPKKVRCFWGAYFYEKKQKAFIITWLEQKHPLKDWLEPFMIARRTFYYNLGQKGKDK